MKPVVLTVGCGVALLLASASAWADDKPVKPAPAPALSRMVADTQPTTPATTPRVQTATPRPALDLRIRDIREYMTPEEFQAALRAPDEDRDTVVVQARVPLLLMKHEKQVPGGIVAPFWAIANPTLAWRIFLPDVNQPPSGPPENKIPPPVFRWGP